MGAEDEFSSTAMQLVPSISQHLGGLEGAFRRVLNPATVSMLVERVCSHLKGSSALRLVVCSRRALRHVQGHLQGYTVSRM